MDGTSQNHYYDSSYSIFNALDPRRWFVALIVGRGLEELNPSRGVQGVRAFQIRALILQSSIVGNMVCYCRLDAECWASLLARL